MPEPDPAREPAAVGSLIRRALQITKRRWIVLAATALAVVACEGAVHYFVRVPHADEIAQAVLPSILVALAYGLAGADIAQQPPPGELWTRVLERLWAVVVIGAAQTLLDAAVISSATGSTIQSFFVGLAVMLVGIVLAFSDVVAVVQPGLRTLQLLPFCIARSARLVANGVTWMRVLALLIVSEIVLDAAAIGSQSLGAAGSAASFWVYAVAYAGAIAVLSIFLTVLYFDADVRDRLARPDADR